MIQNRTGFHWIRGPSACYMSPMLVLFPRRLVCLHPGPLPAQFCVLCNQLAPAVDGDLAQRFHTRFARHKLPSPVIDGPICQIITSIVAQAVVTPAQLRIPLDFLKHFQNNVFAIRLRDCSKYLFNQKILRLRFFYP